MWTYIYGSTIECIQEQLEGTIWAQSKFCQSFANKGVKESNVYDLIVRMILKSIVATTW